MITLLGEVAGVSKIYDSPVAGYLVCAIWGAAIYSLIAEAVKL